MVTDERRCAQGAWVSQAYKTMYLTVNLYICESGNALQEQCPKTHLKEAAAVRKHAVVAERPPQVGVQPGVGRRQRQRHAVDVAGAGAAQVQLATKGVVFGHRLRLQRGRSSDRHKGMQYNAVGKSSGRPLSPLAAELASSIQHDRTTDLSATRARHGPPAH